METMSIEVMRPVTFTNNSYRQRIYSIISYIRTYTVFLGIVNSTAEHVEQEVKLLYEN
jgi:hypothetical protein